MSSTGPKKQVTSLYACCAMEAKTNPPRHQKDIKTYPAASCKPAWIEIRFQGQPRGLASSGGSQRSRQGCLLERHGDLWCSSAAFLWAEWPLQPSTTSWDRKLALWMLWVADDLATFMPHGKIRESVPMALVFLRVRGSHSLRRRWQADMCFGGWGTSSAAGSCTESQHVTSRVVGRVVPGCATEWEFQEAGSSRARLWTTTATSWLPCTRSQPGMYLTARSRSHSMCWSPTSTCARPPLPLRGRQKELVTSMEWTRALNKTEVGAGGREPMKKGLCQAGVAVVLCQHHTQEATLGFPQRWERVNNSQLFVQTPALTDSKGNWQVFNKLMTTKFPLCTVIMELASHTGKRGVRTDAWWTPRERNQETDVLSSVGVPRPSGRRERRS